MKRKLLIALVCSLIVFTLSPFAVAAKQSNKEGLPAEFTAGASITQIHETANPEYLGDMGNGVLYYRTVGEQLTGRIDSCEEWQTLVDASIYMDNDSYYTLDSTDTAISGTSIATVEIRTNDHKGKLSFQVAGTMTGSLYSGVKAKMFVIPGSVKSEGVLKQTVPTTISADFYWTLDGSGNIIGGGGLGTIEGNFQAK